MASKTEMVRDYLETPPDANPREIVAAMKELGFDITSMAASQIQHLANQREAQRLVTQDHQAGNHQSGTKPRRGAKADAIRQVFRARGPAVRSKDVIAELASQGIQVSHSQVVSVRNALDPEQGARKSAARRSRSDEQAMEDPDSIPLVNLLAAKKFIEQVGSFKAAEQAILALAKLQSV